MNGEIQMSAKTKRKFRFNIIDALLVLLALAAVAVIIFVIKPGSKTSENKTVEIEYTVEVSPLRDEFRGDQFIKEGDKVIDSVYNMELGTVISVEYRAALETAITDDGEMVENELPNRTDLLVTIRATADTSSGFYNVNGKEIACGSEYSFYVPNLVAIGNCIRIVEVDG